MSTDYWPPVESFIACENAVIAAQADLDAASAAALAASSHHCGLRGIIHEINGVQTKHTCPWCSIHEDHDKAYLRHLAAKRAYFSAVAEENGVWS